MLLRVGIVVLSALFALLSGCAESFEEEPEVRVAESGNAYAGDWLAVGDWLGRARSHVSLASALGSRGVARIYDGPRDDGNCSGFMIGSEYLLTAHHCIEEMGYGAPGEEYTVRFGAWTDTNDPIETWEHDSPIHRGRREFIRRTDELRMPVDVGGYFEILEWTCVLSYSKIRGADISLLYCPPRGIDSWVPNNRDAYNLVGPAAWDAVPSFEVGAGDIAGIFEMGGRAPRRSETLRAAGFGRTEQMEDDIFELIGGFEGTSQYGSVVVSGSGNVVRESAECARSPRLRTKFEDCFGSHADADCGMSGGPAIFRGNVVRGLVQGGGRCGDIEPQPRPWLTSNIFSTLGANVRDAILVHSRIGSTKPDRLPVNFDWDLSGGDDAPAPPPSPVSRFGRPSANEVDVNLVCPRDHMVTGLLMHERKPGSAVSQMLSMALVCTPYRNPGAGPLAIASEDWRTVGWIGADVVESTRGRVGPRLAPELLPQAYHTYRNTTVLRGEAIFDQPPGPREWLCPSGTRVAGMGGYPDGIRQSGLRPQWLECTRYHPDVPVAFDRDGGYPATRESGDFTSTSCADDHVTVGATVSYLGSGVVIGLEFICAPLSESL